MDFNEQLFVVHYEAKGHLQDMVMESSASLPDITISAQSFLWLKCVDVNL